MKLYTYRIALAFIATILSGNLIAMSLGWEGSKFKIDNKSDKDINIQITPAWGRYVADLKPLDFSIPKKSVKDIATSDLGAANTFTISGLSDKKMRVNCSNSFQRIGTVEINKDKIVCDGQPASQVPA
jgi:hypothetical protein